MWPKASLKKWIKQIKKVERKEKEQKRKEGTEKEREGTEKEREGIAVEVKTDKYQTAVASATLTPFDFTTLGEKVLLIHA